MCRANVFQNLHFHYGVAERYLFCLRRELHTKIICFKKKKHWNYYVALLAGREHTNKRERSSLGTLDYALLMRREAYLFSPMMLYFYSRLNQILYNFFENIFQNYFFIFDKTENDGIPIFVKMLKMRFGTDFVKNEN